MAEKPAPKPEKPEPKAPPAKVKAEKPAPAKAKPVAELPAAKPRPAPEPAKVKVPPLPKEPEEPLRPAECAPEAPLPFAIQDEPLPLARTLTQEEISPPPPPEAPPEEAPLPEPPARSGWFHRLRDGLSKSSRSLTSGITDIFTKRKLDATTLEELEDVLIQADLGIDMATRITEAVAKGRYDKEIDPDEVRRILAAEVEKVLKPVEVPFTFDEAQKPFVVLVVGVNGSGKTTTIGKLGAIAVDEGFSVLLAACDTFRAAAIEQLAVWGERIGAKVVSRPTGADAAGLAYDALAEARRTGTDIVFIDTAGRLQNKAELMAELEKIVRVIKKQDDDRAACGASGARCHHGAERRVAGRRLHPHRRRDRSRYDQARRHRAGRHSGGHRRALQSAGARHRRRRAGGGSATLRCRSIFPRHRRAR